LKCQVRMTVIFVMKDKKFKVRSSIAFVQSNEMLEMFKTNVREQVLLKVGFQNIINLISEFDGVSSVEDTFKKYNCFYEEEFYQLIEFLNSRKIIIEIDELYSDLEYEENYRTINFLEEYFDKTSDVKKALKKIQNKIVLVVGLGAVGTWVVDCLARTGVKNFILVDPDKVEISNLHRQDMFFEADIGIQKTECVRRELYKIGVSEVFTINQFFDRNFFNIHDIDFDLAINCSDFPSVDETSHILSEECMKRNKPHIVGGGYNLHLSLIGQSIIPFKTPCFKCFESNLQKINDIEIQGVRKLVNRNRKIGSFSPLSSLAASYVSSEALKILIDSYESLTTTGKRIEFITDNFDIQQFNISKEKDCIWCGANGKYSN